MIEKKDITALPFVDGTPDPNARPDQASIDWIKNGECADGAQSSIGHEGSMNRAGVSVQENVVEVQKNIGIVKSSLDETIDIVNKHADIIAQEGNLDLIKTVQKHTDEIETLNFAVVQNSERLSSVIDETKKNTDEIGVVPSHDTADRTIREELEWQKAEMGSYPGFDYNGKPNVDSRGTGMKNRIINNSMAISDHNSRLNDLEYNWQVSDVGSLTREVQSIRVELGPSSSKVPGNDVYKRLKRTEDITTGNRTDVDALREHTGIAGFPRPDARTLIQLVDLNSSHIDALKNSLTESEDRILVVENTIGTSNIPDTILYNQRISMQNINDLYSIVGKTNSEGLRYSVAVLETEMGNDATTGTIKNRVLLTEQGIRDLNIQIDALNDALGVSGNGSGTFSDRVVELELQMNGDPNGVTEFEKTGLYPFAYDIYTKGVVTDTNDPGYFVRTNGSWIPVGSFDLNITASISVDGKKFIQPDGDSAVKIGTSGKDINLESVLSHVSVRDSVQITHKDGIQDRTSQLARYSATEDSKKITLGDSQTDIELMGTKVLINGVDLGDATILDVQDEDSYFRTKGKWQNFKDTPVLISEITSPTGDAVLRNTETMTSIGSGPIPLSIKGVSDITLREGFAMLDPNGEEVIKVDSDRIEFEKTLMIEGQKVITTGDDAPNDDNYYARYKGTWAKVSPDGAGSGGGIADVPNDHKSYIRKDQEWVELGTESLTMFDELSIQWAVDSTNTTGLSYSQSTNKLSLGGSGSKLELIGEISTALLSDGSSITQKLGTQTATVFTNDTDRNLLIGDKDLNKSVILRSEESPQIQTKTGQYRLWHSGDDARQDGQMYARKDGQWVVSTVNRTQDVILNQGISFKVIDTKDKILTVATAGSDNLIQLGESSSLMNIRSTVRTLNLDNKVHITANDGTKKINLIGKSDDVLEIGAATMKTALSGSELTFNGKKVITSDDDAPNDEFKYVRAQNSWTKAYGFGENAPSAVGAKEGDIYFQYM